MPRVLIVDDHAGFRSVARALLEGDGFTVVGEADDGINALEAVRQLRPDVVLLDVQLPGRDGFEVCEELAGGAGAPTVVLTSGLSAASLRFRLAGSSARGFIQKRDLAPGALQGVLGSE